MNKCSFLIIVILTIFVRESEGLRFIRDAETESVISQIAKPIFSTAHISSDIKVHIIEDSQINAFILDGRNIFLNTGLISFTNNPNAIAGVIAHECGHINGGHILQSSDHMKKINNASIFGTILGIAGAIGGAPELGAATIIGSKEAATRNIIGYTLKHENEADIKASEYMQTLNIDTSGLISLLRSIDKESRTNQPYNKNTLRTHPLARERIEFLYRNNKYNPKEQSILSEKIKRNFAMASAKIYAYTNTYSNTIKKYQGETKEDLYAQSIALFRKHKTEAALDKLGILLKLDPSNPYLHELKGQFHLETRNIPAAISNYNIALSLLPTSCLIKLQLATCMIIEGGKNNIESAISLLQSASNQEPFNSMIWRQMSIAYNKAGNIFASQVALAKEAHIMENTTQKEKFLNIAKKHKASSEKFIMQIYKDLMSLKPVI